MITKDESYKQVEHLVNRFAENIDSYKSFDYNETQTRRDFIDPFFKALGWDIDNSQGFAEAYREVIHEDKVKVGKATKAPDYSFRLSGGKRLFFVEAKKPSVYVKDDISVAYQVRRYGWSAKLAVSIVTDFEEFAVFDCTKKPIPTDKPLLARIKYITYDKYLSEFDYLWNTFSKEQVLKGSFDRYVQSDTIKKGTATVDKEFLASLDSWRTYLATSISIKNRELDEDEINFAVQQTIDRLIFLRIAEDRGVEPYGQLRSSVNQKGEAFENLFYNFKKADEKYNSGLFDFNKDIISEKLKVDSKVVKTIVNDMYYPESPYEFSVISVEILGSAYEQFLGKQIKVEIGHRAKIEEKPEVRKAGGVYYTPQYIVEYIVKNTLGNLIEGKTPKQIEKIKICDPACGSGSFLIGAYQYLLDYHKNLYTENGTKIGKKDSPITPEGNLTSTEKKRILLNNIYGVDIDFNAVEVTKLSLLLKCMEGETETTIAQQYRLWHDRILPTLDNNIKSGNSLIDTDFYDSIIDFGEEKKIKPFNWQKSFHDVFIQGGFDVIIGNPPYVQPNILDKSSQSYLFNHFKANTDLYSIFVERSLVLLKENHLLGFIVPSLFLKGVRYNNLRDIINTICLTAKIKEYGDGVFEKVQMPTCVIILEKGNSKKKQDFFKNKNTSLFSKIKTIGLQEISQTRRGLEIGKDKLHENGIIECITGGNLDRYILKGKKYITEETYKSFSKDKDIFNAPKIMVRETGNKFFASIDYNGILTTRSIYNTQIVNKNYSCEFILGIINSSLFKFYFKQFIAPETNIFPKIRIIQLNEIPIPKEFNQSQKSEIEKNAVLLFKLNEEMQKAKLQSSSDQIQTRIDYCENRINKIVYQLYELTEDEIKIIEGK